MQKRNNLICLTKHLHASCDAQRRAKIDQTIKAFRGNTDRATMVALAAEIVRLNRNIVVLRDGVEQSIAGKQFVLSHEGPYAEQNKAQERKRDRAAKWL
jgi:hypothetical protein